MKGCARLGLAVNVDASLKKEPAIVEKADKALLAGSLSILKSDLDSNCLLGMDDKPPMPLCDDTMSDSPDDLQKACP